MKRLLSIVMSIAVLLVGASTALAAQEIIEADGSYVMDSRLDETAATATARAREEAKRAAVDKAGVYLEAYAKTVDLVLEQDEIRTVTAHFLKVLDEKPSVAVIQDNLLEFTVHIKALVDVTDAERLKSMLKDKTQLEIMTEQNRELQSKYDELKAQMEALKRNYDSADESQRAQLKREAARNDEYFKAMQELERGNEFYSGGDYASALECYNRSLAIDANYFVARNNRANTYAALGRYQNALDDLKAALTLRPDSAEAHNNLGSVCVSLNRLDEALSEYSTALKLKPNYAAAWYNRSGVYYRQKKYSEALSDAQRAAALEPNNAAFREFLVRCQRRV